MGNEFSCNCDCKKENNEKKSFSKTSLEDDNYLPKVKKSDLLFSYLMEFSCSYLVKKSQLQDFFLNRTFFIYNDKKSTNCYYNQLFFLDINDEKTELQISENKSITNRSSIMKKEEKKYVVIMRYDDDFQNSDFTPFNSELFANLSSKYNEYSGKYIMNDKKFDNITGLGDFLINQKEKNLNLTAISNTMNFEFIMVFKYTINNNKTKYSFEKLPKLNNQILSNILNANTKKVLRFIIKIHDSFLIRESEEEKEAVSDKNNFNYLLIFEECYETLDYVVVEVKKKNETHLNEFIKEITYRINSTSISNRISCVFFDNNTVYIVIILKD